MQRRLQLLRHYFLRIPCFCLLLVVLAACNPDGPGITGGNVNPGGTSTTPASKQVLTFPNVGTTDIAVLDPALGADSNSNLAINMIYSGLVRSDKDLNILPDQATWQVSSDQKVFTFTLNPSVKFSDGTPVTAETYIYTWTRALLPTTASPIASFFAAPIVGADEVNSGKTKTLTGMKALDEYTLQVTLKRPTPYFLEMLTNSLFFPLNRKVIEQYGEKNWTQQAVGNGLGTGPFVIKEWSRNTRMVFAPNPHYHGNKTRLTEVIMVFVGDRATAFKGYRAGQYDFVWNLIVTDQQAAEGMKGFLRTPLLQTDLLFFDNTKPPFDQVAVRQAFAYATDKETLVSAVFKDSVVVARTIIPPGMPGYQPNYPGLPYDPAKAKSLLQSVYPDISKVPAITFSYANSQVTPNQAAALQSMWQNALGIQVQLRPVELIAYNTETSKHQVQFGFTQWGADFPDPYDWLTLNLFSTASNNNGQWKNEEFDRLVTQAEQASGAERLALYNQAEQIAITEVGWLPLDHQSQAAVIPPRVHGVTQNGVGLYFGDWSEVYLTEE